MHVTDHVTMIHSRNYARNWPFNWPCNYACNYIFLPDLQHMIVSNRWNESSQIKILRKISTEDRATQRRTNAKKSLTATIRTENLPEYHDFSNVDVFHHFDHILSHEFFAIEASTYSFSLIQNTHLNTW